MVGRERGALDLFLLSRARASETSEAETAVLLRSDWEREDWTLDIISPELVEQEFRILLRLEAKWLAISASLVRPSTDGEPDAP